MEISLQEIGDEIRDRAGCAFASGLTSSSIWHFGMGVRNSTKGERIIAGIHSMGMNAPRSAGKIASVVSLFCVVESAVLYSRQKDDDWNFIAAATAVGGLLNIRDSFRAASRSALFGGAFAAFLFSIDHVNAYLERRAIHNKDNTTSKEDHISDSSSDFESEFH